MSTQFEIIIKKKRFHPHQEQHRVGVVMPNHQQMESCIIYMYINSISFILLIKSLVEVAGVEPASLYPSFQTSTRLFCRKFQKVTQQTSLPFLFVLLLYRVSNEKTISGSPVNDANTKLAE